jgi:hypothetical protein
MSPGKRTPAFAGDRAFPHVRATARYHRSRRWRRRRLPQAAPPKSDAVPIVCAYRAVATHRHVARGRHPIQDSTLWARRTQSMRPTKTMQNGGGAPSEGMSLAFRSWLLGTLTVGNLTTLCGRIRVWLRARFVEPRLHAVRV